MLHRVTNDRVREAASQRRRGQRMSGVGRALRYGRAGIEEGLPHGRFEPSPDFGQQAAVKVFQSGRSIRCHPGAGHRAEVTSKLH